MKISFQLSGNVREIDTQKAARGGNEQNIICLICLLLGNEGTTWYNDGQCG